jgi:hypothetical protein
MGRALKMLAGFFMTAWLFTGFLAASQANQQTASTTSSSTVSSAQSNDFGKSSEAAKPDTKTETSAQPSGNSPQSSNEKAKDDVQSRDVQEKDKDDAPRHRSHVRLGTIGFGASYTRFPAGFFSYYGYGFYPDGYGAFYSPLVYGFYDPFYNLYYPGVYGGSLGYGVNKGEVKLSTRQKGAQVYLNGAFAGPADKLKSMWLEPGAYDLSVSAPDGHKFQQRIYVISGKTLKIRAQLTAQ